MAFQVGHTKDRYATQSKPHQSAPPLPNVAENTSAAQVLEKLDDAQKWVESAIECVSTLPLTVVMPAYNEILTLRKVVDAVRALPIDKQIIVVDDGSKDGTRELIHSLVESHGVEAIFHDVNRGKGAAIQTGFANARGDIVIVQDADLEYNPEDILKVIAPIQNGTASVVYGSRYLQSTAHNDSWIHRLGNGCLTGLSNLASGQKLTDMETCYKAFRRELLQSIAIEQNRFGFEPEITAKLARRGIAIQEVPIRYQPRSWDEGKKIGVKDLFNALWCILRYRFKG